MNLDVRDLRLVIAIDAEGGLTRAGAVVKLTQSALSHRLADLEQRIGTPLFMRVGRRMVLTPAGEWLRDRGRPILDSICRVERELEEVAEARSGLLRFSAECSTGYDWLPAVLREYRRNHPHVETRLVAEAASRPIPALLRGELDLAVVSSPAEDPRLSLHPLFQDELVAIVGPDHPWTSRTVVAAGDFEDQHLITHCSRQSESALFREVLEPAGVIPNQVSQIGMIEAILELVRAGLGVAVLGRWPVARALQCGTVHAIPITPGIVRQWCAATLKQKVVPPHLTAFVHLMMRSLSPMTVPAR